MDPFKQQQLIITMSWIFGILLLMIYGGPIMFLLSALLLFLLMVFRAMKIQDKKRFKFFLIVLYIVTFLIQVLFYGGLFGYMQGATWLLMFQNLLRIFVLSIPLLLEYMVTVSRYTEFYFPSVQEMNTISFGQMRRGINTMKYGAQSFDELRKTASFGKLKEIAVDIPRHSVIRYVNDGSLTKAYFEAATRSLDDNGVYIIISSTGSTVSEMISIFTRKQYNHASISFDRDLTTIISYNGGENVYPPGLNHELIEYFNKKKDASLMVYRMACTKDQKRQLIQLVQDINTTGSAYNMLGPLFRSSVRPNIMFCSQFVYKMLTSVGLAYFEKPGGLVKPTDLVELDYRRRLTFCYELMLNEPEAVSDKANI